MGGNMIREIFVDLNEEELIEISFDNGKIKIITRLHDGQ